MATKTITVRGKQVQVEDFDVVDNAIPAKLLRAIIGSVKVEKTVTFAAVDGLRIILTQAQVQSDLDVVRQQLADEAVWQEELKILLQGVS